LGGGHWWLTEGYWPLLDDLRQAMRAATPGKMLTTECNAETYARHFDGFLTWHCQVDKAVPVLAAIYGGKIQSFGRSYGGDHAAHRMRIAQSLVFGEQLGWIDPSIVLDDPDTGNMFRRYAKMRHHLLAHLARGTLARPPQTDGAITEVTADWAWGGKRIVTDSALQAAAWRAVDGSVAFLFANSSLQKLNFVWEFAAHDYGLEPGNLVVRPVDADGPEALQSTDGAFRREIDIEPLGVAAFVLSNAE
jgi:hypothetical protein